MKKLLFLVITVVLILCFSLFSCGQTEDAIIGISLMEGTLKTTYEVGEEMDLSGGHIIVTYQSGKTEPVAINSSMVDSSKFSTAVVASRKTLAIVYNNFSCNLVYSVSAPEPVSKIERVYLEDMQTEFLKGESYSATNGILDQGTLCIDLGENNIKTYSIKTTWLKNFSTNKAGAASCDIFYQSDYGDVSVKWNFTVQNLASISSVEISSDAIAVYQYSLIDSLKSALKNIVFTLKYSDDSSAELPYSPAFVISGFSSEQTGDKNCFITLVDAQKRSTRYTLAYKVKLNYDVYKVTFNENFVGGTTVIENTLDGLVVPRSLSRLGYNALGWYLYKEGKLASLPYDFSEIIESDIELRPRWQRETYTIQYYHFDKLINTDTYDVDTEMPIPLPDAVPGYTFDHYVDANNKTISGITKGTTGNITLYGIWIADGFKLTYKLNDNEAQRATNPNPAQYIPNTTLVFMPAERKGYTFTGWLYNNSAITSTEGRSGALELTATWSLDTYSLTFVNGKTQEEKGTINFKVTDSNTKINNLTQEGFIFEGWYIDKEYSEEYYKNSQNEYYIPAGSAGNINLYAKVKECCYLVLDTRKTSTETNPVITITLTEEDDNVEIPLPELFGFDFMYWINKGINCTLRPQNEKIVTSYNAIKDLISQNSSGDTPKHTLMLTAIYASHEWKITYHLYYDRANNDITEEAKYDTSVNTPLITPTRNGYKFLAWYDNADLSGTSHDTVLAASKDKDLDFYAKWSAEEYTITLHYGFDGVEEVNIPSVYTPDFADFKLLSPVYNNYVFEGWFEDENFSGQQHPTTIYKGSYGNLELYAKWGLEKYQMNLHNMDNATYTGSAEYTIESGTVTLLTAERKGYDFDGWYTDDTFTTAVTQFEASQYKQSVFTAYAKWKLLSYNIIYTLNDDNANPSINLNPTTYTIEDTIVFSAPTRNGYDFGGWYSVQKDKSGNFNENAKVVSISKLSREYTVFAKWTKGSYSLQYDNCNYEGVDISSFAQTYTIDGYTLPKPTRLHYTFSGWQTADGDTITAVGAAAYPCQNLLITAVWDAINYKLNLTVNGIKKTHLYNIEDFDNQSYTLPSLDELINLGVYEQSSFAGRTFESWQKNSADISVISITELADQNLSARLGYKTYTIAYQMDANAQNSSTNPVQFTTETASVSVADPTLENMVFKGWYTDPEYSISAGIRSNGITTVSTTPNNIKLFAAFVPVYTITYQNDEGMVLANKPQTYNEVEPITLGNPTHTGMTFGGWWSKNEAMVVTSTSQLSGNAILIPMFYASTATPSLKFSIVGSTAKLDGYSGSAKNITLPNTVGGMPLTTIESSAFASSAITSITLNSNLTNIGSYAFSESALTSITIPEGVQTIETNAFASCTSLASLRVNGGTTIRANAFKNCSALNYVYISTSAVVVEGILGGCTALTTICCGSSMQLPLYFGKTYNAQSYLCGSYYIPNSLTVIYFLGEGSTDNTFQNCTSINEMHIVSDTFVEIASADQVILNGDNVYVIGALVSQYSTTYPDINFIGE